MGIGPVESEPIIRLPGNVRQIDTEEGEPEVAFGPDLPPVEFKDLKLNIPKEGVASEPMGVGRLIRPMIDVGRADQIQNPVGRKFVKGSSWLLDKLHTGISYVYAAVAAVDKYVFEKGLDHLSGLSRVENKTAQTHLRWMERGLAATAGAALYQGVRSKSAMEGVRGAGRFWRGAWPIGAILYVSQTKIASNLEEGAGLAALGGAILLLNYPTNAAYRSVITGPEGAKPMALKWGVAFALSHFGLNYYWDNFSAQSRILPALHGKPQTDAYWPTEWDWDYTQAKTTYSHSIGWGIAGAAWGSLLHWQTNLTDKGFRKVFGYGKSDLQIVPGTASHRFVHSGLGSRWAVGRGAKAFLASFAPRRLGFTAASTAVGLPLGIALGRMTFEAQDFSSMEAVTGTPARAVITAPLSTAGISACAAMFGVAHPWCAYAWNMYPVNWRWQAEAQQGEILYQVAKKLADDYQSSRDANEKRHIATNLFNLHRVALNKAKRKDETSEKERIGVLLADAGLDVNAIEEAAIRYASPQP